MNDDIDRRTVLTWTGTAAATVAVAGCLGNGDDDEDGEDENDDEDDELEITFPEVEDPPDAVYRPTHRESMVMVDPVEAGDYRLAPMLSYPHPFWIVSGSGEDGISHEVPDEPGVHMMFTLWDAETDTVLPVDDGIELEIRADGDRIESQSSWSMLSQQMGFHFGDNVPLEEDGTYTVDVELPPLSVRTTGDLEDRFTDSETATFEFEFDEEFRAVVTDIEYFDEERWGERGALEPMGHGNDGHGHDHDDHDHDDHDEHDEIPYSQVPNVDAFSGTVLAEPGEEPPDETANLPRSGDAAVLATLLESDSRLSDGDERYLLVSPRTPYNRVPLPAMSLQAAVERDGETVAETPLEQTIDSEYDLHYGGSIVDIEPGDAVTITVDSPPQVARHQGYETAFFEMPAIEFEVPDDR